MIPQASPPKRLRVRGYLVTVAVCWLVFLFVGAVHLIYRGDHPDSLHGFVIGALLFSVVCSPVILFARLSEGFLNREFNVESCLRAALLVHCIQWLTAVTYLVCCASIIVGSKSAKGFPFHFG